MLVEAAFADANISIYANVAQGCNGNSHERVDEMNTDFTSKITLETKRWGRYFL